ncbi:MAG: DJ-1/PfpI family protein [Candidatus Krumholzibacteria bacterium]|nr:DJ-1/PfpI family protein [Candidatus Krumholzibacteria bacterium]
MGATKTCVLYYDGFAEFEIVLACLAMSRGEIVAVGPSLDPVTSEEKQRLLPDIALADVDPADVDLLIIPGGDPAALIGDETLAGLLRDLAGREVPIAAICGGTALLAAAGLLDGRECTGGGDSIDDLDELAAYFKNAIIVDEDVVIDGRIVTATGRAFVEFAFEVGDLMGVFESEEEANTQYWWFKNVYDED